MAKNNAVKTHSKAQAIKGAAIGTFSVAKAKVEEANTLLEESIHIDESTIEAIESSILGLNQQLNSVKLDKQQKVFEIEENDKLINRLSAFA